MFKFQERAGRGAKSAEDNLSTFIRLVIYLPVYRHSYKGNYALSVLKGIAGPEQNFERP